MDEKWSVTFGMGMTEKQGGTDVRSNTTTAVAGGPDGSHVLTGHKWFLSAPMSDAFSCWRRRRAASPCFFMPRFLPDGSVNAIHLVRLKSKLGNRANAFGGGGASGTAAWLVGEEGRGVATIIDMVTWTRLDCATSSAGLMAVGAGTCDPPCGRPARIRVLLIEQPLMRHVLADVALDVEAATVLAFWLGAHVRRWQ